MVKVVGRKQQKRKKKEKARKIEIVENKERSENRILKKCRKYGRGGRRRLS